MSGKGDKIRPKQISTEEYNRRWEKAFNSNEREVQKPTKSKIRKQLANTLKKCNTAENIKYAEEMAKEINTIDDIEDIKSMTF